MDVELTSSHLGYWELRLCPTKPPTQACFDRHVLHFAGGRGTKFNVTTNDHGHENGSKYYSTAVQLPRHVKCENCLIQWHYRTGSAIQSIKQYSLIMYNF